ncbi:hypothetical protein Hanom_Chr13g01211171 [Helianthus anomalus]
MLTISGDQTSECGGGRWIQGSPDLLSVSLINTTEGSFVIAGTEERRRETDLRSE